MKFLSLLSLMALDPSRKSYIDIASIENFLDRYEYLKLDGQVGVETFGWDRFLNQDFYHSDYWKRIRRDVILRDNGCDMGHPDYPINGRIIIHHINPITPNDILYHSDELITMDNLICVSDRTHRAIHYGTEELLPGQIITRTRNDTCPWKHGG